MDGGIAPRKSLRYELVFVVLVAAAVLVPGIWSYTLVDPWETHYGEVSRNMLVDNDYVFTQWPGTNLDDQANEGFRSKPVLQFWMMAAGLKSMGVGAHGGYSGEMVASVRTLIGIRLPFVLSAIGGLVMLWWMLARLVSRRVAWLSLLVVGSTPFFCLVSRQAIPDMPLVASTIGALALFTLGVEDGERPLRRFRVWRWSFDARHVVLGLLGGFAAVQLVYDGVYFILMRDDWAFRGYVPNPALWLPAIGALMLLALWSPAFRIIGRIPGIILGAPITLLSAAHDGRLLLDLGTWENYALDRFVLLCCASLFRGERFGSPASHRFADDVLFTKPITTMRQVYMLGCYGMLGIGILAKGPPGLAVVGGVGVFHVVLLGRWRALAEGSFEIKRGLLLMCVIALPWHIAVWMKAGPAWLSEYLYMHILNRATSGVDNSPGTFEYYTSQIGHGMWLWAALLPAAIGSCIARARIATREGRVRFMIVVWAIVGTAFFSLVQTKFHHYILPVVPAFGVLVAFFLDDVLAGRERLHPLYAALAIGIVFLVGRDLMFEPERWIEMFVFRYDRPWPSGEPWVVDPSDAFLGLAIAAACAVAVMGIARLRKVGVWLVCGVGLVICVWSLQVYMPIAGTHWGMREAVRTYYEQRTIYGETIVYFDADQLRADWGDATRTRISFDTFIPDTLQVGQPMTVKVQLRKADDERVMQETVTLVGAATKIGDHSVEITLAPGERAKLNGMAKVAVKAGGGGRHRPIYAVDADRLIAWQLYWRGEQFWSGGEIWDVGNYLPDMRTSFPATNNTEFTKYLNDRARMPIGRRYFVVTDGGRVNSVKGMLPTQRGKDSYMVLDQTSNKFALGAFDL